MCSLGKQLPVLSPAKEGPVFGWAFKYRALRFIQDDVTGRLIRKL
jgi:hypothetical protein